MKEKDIESLQHTTWRCQYHVVFAPKYRRMAIYGQIRRDIGQILRKLCEQKGVEIIEAQACPDHIHLLNLSLLISALIDLIELRPKHFSVFQNRRIWLNCQCVNRHGIVPATLRLRNIKL